MGTPQRGCPDTATLLEELGMNKRHALVEDYITLNGKLGGGTLDLRFKLLAPEDLLSSYCGR